MRLVDRAAVIDKIVYCLTNPVKDMLVEKVHQWPGVNSYVAMRNRSTVTVSRPRHFFRAEKKMEPVVEIKFAIPDVLGDSDHVFREIAEGVRAVEAQCAAERARTGARVLGVRAIKKETWTKRASSDEPRQGFSPTIACRDRDSRIAALLQLREFLALYRLAHDEWIVGKVSVFPPGTYRLKRFTASAPSPFS